MLASQQAKAYKQSTPVKDATAKALSAAKKGKAFCFVKRAGAQVIPSSRTSRWKEQTFALLNQHTETLLKSVSEFVVLKIHLVPETDYLSSHRAREREVEESAKEMMKRERVEEATRRRFDKLLSKSFSKMPRANGENGEMEQKGKCCTAHHRVQRSRKCRIVNEEWVDCANKPSRAVALAWFSGTRESYLVNFGFFHPNVN